MTGSREARPEPLPAATVVLLRPGPDEPEVLLIHRPTTMAFGPGLHAFPGGRVDPGDADAPAAEDGLTAADAAIALGGNVTPVEALALHVAAARELLEEVGVDIPIDALAPIGHWTTPTFMPRRFSTWFFVADLPAGAEPRFAPAEVAAHRWVTPSAALDQMAAGEIDMWVPTSSVLQRLLEIGARTAGDVRRAVSIGPAPRPRIVDERPDRVVFAFGAAGGLPGRTATTTLLGRRELVLVDPGDPSEDAIDAIVDAAAPRGAIRAIVLTSPGPDHAAGAEALAIPLEIPILVAPGAGRHLPYAVREVADGERLPADVDLRVRLGAAGSGRLDVPGASAGE